MHLNKLKRTQRIVFQLITIMRLRNLFRIKKEAWAPVKALDSLNSSNVEYSDPEQMLQQQIGFPAVQKRVIALISPGD